MKTSFVAARAASVVVCLLSAVGGASAQTVPAPWTASDVGAPTLAGSSSFANGIFSIEASGEDIGKESDEFHFVYQAVKGDVDIRARIDDLTRAHVWSKAGVMIRGSLAPQSAHAYAFVSADRGTGLLTRRTDAVSSTMAAGPQENAPYWVRLARVGTRITAYTSVDGATWTAVGSDTVALGATAYVGLAATSRHRAMRTSATISSVVVQTAAPPPTGGLPNGQADRDVGSPAIAGSASHSNGQYTVRGSGNDIWGAADQFHYLYQPVTGDVDVAARVASLTATNSYAKAGVMIRESLAAGSRHAFMMGTKRGGYAFERRVQPDAWSDHTEGVAAGMPGWVRLVRKGDVVTAYQSADGATWKTVGSATIPMGATVYVGLATTSHDVATLATAALDNLRVTVPSGTTNNPPAVLLSSPVNGATYQNPASVTLNAAATDSDGTVQRVEFFANGTRLGSDPTAPYAWPTTFGQGTHTITALAVDDSGATTVSDPVIITVTASTPTTPQTLVAFTASASHATLVVKYVLEVYAAGATPGQSAPLATSDLGKPAPSSTGDITVDRSAFFQNLTPGNYLAAVVAVGSSSTARSASVAFTR